MNSPLCCGAGRLRSWTIATVASQMPSASASQRRTTMRCRAGSGMSRDTGLTLSRYSTITRESYSDVPSSSTSTGTLPSGLNCCACDEASNGASATASYSIFFSASTMRTLRA